MNVPTQRGLSVGATQASRMVRPASTSEGPCSLGKTRRVCLGGRDSNRTGNVDRLSPPVRKERPERSGLSWPGRPRSDT